MQADSISVVIPVYNSQQEEQNIFFRDFASRFIVDCIIKIYDS